MSTATTSEYKSATPPKPGLSDRDWRVLDATFSIDSRALSVVRVVMGVLLLYQALFLDSPAPQDLSWWMESAYRYSSVLMVPLALMLIVGYRTRLVVALCWLVYTVPIRADLLSDRTVPMGYYLLSLALFWCIFLPVGRHLSLDSRGGPNAPVRFLSVASAALLFQIFIVYFSAGLFKDLGEWVVDATAMQSILGHPNYETALGTTLLGYPVILAVMSVATFALEVVGSLLVILPGKSLATRRLVIVPVFVALHIMIAALIGLGLFPYVMMTLWLVFLPPNFWDRVWAAFGSNRNAIDSLVDRNTWRNGVAGVAVLIASVSNVIVWAFYQNTDSMPAFFAWFQDMAIALVLFQRWLMFNVPSMIPL